MPGFTLNASVYVFDASRAEEVIHHFQETEMRRAIRAFLTACLARIPVRTGFLKGSFGNISRFFGNGPITDLNAKITALFRQQQAGGAGSTSSARGRQLALKQARRGTGNRRANPLRQEYYYPETGAKVLKTPYSGLPYATPQEQVLTRKGDVLTFNLNIDITYYRINDFYAKIRGAPWNSLQAGQEALLASLASAASRFPTLAEIAGTARIRVEGTRKSVSVEPPVKKFLFSPLS